MQNTKQNRIKLRLFAWPLALTAAALGAALFVSTAPMAQDAAAPAAAPAEAPAAEAPAAEAPPAPPVDPLVEKGAYLARAGNCLSCHTREGGEPFAGGLGFSTPYTFLGEIHSTNITPDPETGIGT